MLMFIWHSIFKVFVGSGVGAPFGPRCHKGDIMGCGVLFPRNYECKSDSEEELEQQGGVDQYGGKIILHLYKDCLD